jgi:hypothetical protein
LIRVVLPGVLLLLVAAVATGPVTSAIRGDRAPQQTVVPSNTAAAAAVMCEPTPATRHNLSGLGGPATLQMAIGGRLASVGPSDVFAGVIDKKTWLLRDGPWPDWITLRARYLHGSAEQLFYVSICGNCGVRDAVWGSGRAYAHRDFGFRQTGCWRIELVDGQSDDYVVVRVVPRSP